jgi:2-polyprenyl-3-methyl-5-hydroxy-6-metoxy-1,4-benzoquinol methylase
VARYAVLAGYLRVCGRALQILDVGCGAGTFVPHLHPATVGRYVGVDPSAAAIAKAQRHAGASVELRVGTVDAVAARFDAVVLNEVLAMVDDPGALVDAAIARLHDDGLVVTSICRHGGDDRLWTLLDERLHEHDAVVIANAATSVAPSGWRVARHGRRP